MLFPDLIQVRLHGGHGPCVVLLHGGPGAPGEMFPVAHALKNQFRIIEPLQRTSGESPLSVESHVDDLRDALKDIVTRESLSIVGHSWGAMLALTYAARHPESIDRIILIGCGTFDEHARNVYQANLENRTDPETKQRIERIRSCLDEEKSRTRRNELFGKFGSIMTRLQAFDPIEAPPALEAPTFDEQGHHETWNDALALQKQGVQPAEFSNIRVAVIMIHGREDPHPGRLVRKSLEPYLKDFQYQELPNCGHTPWIERGAREAFYDLLSSCLT